MYAKWPEDWKLRPLYAVCKNPRSEPADIWTVSPDPEVEGWETDSGYPGYGLPGAVAEHLAALHNANLSQC